MVEAGRKATAGARVRSHAMTAAPRSRRPVATVALVLAVVLAACTGSSGTAPTADADRVTAIRTARQTVVEPAQALGTAAAEAAARLETLVARPGAGTVAATRTALADLVDAREAVEALELDAPTEDVRTAAAALDDAATGAGALEDAAGTVADAAERATAVADDLRAVVTAWDERGSRSQLLERFDELEAEARGLADDTEPPEACPGPVEGAVAAAAFVADATAELREFVAQRDGNGFDARRAELDAAPYGTTDSGEPRDLDAAVDTDDCPAIGEAEAAAADVAAALRNLQQALNPTDLEP